MKFNFHQRIILGAVLIGVMTTVDASDKTVIESVKAMERDLSLTITMPMNLVRSVEHSQRTPDHYTLFPPTISPDGTALVWGLIPYPDPGERIPFAVVESLNRGKEPIWVDGRVTTGSIGVSFRAEVIVAIAFPYPSQSSRWELLAIDRRSGAVVHDLTQFVTQFEFGNYVEVNVSGSGTLAALGSRRAEQIQVLEITNGKSIYTGPGRYPRLSPDGKRLAFVDKDKLWIHSFADGSTVQLVKGKRVKGVGGWSPDGRFLLAGAWTTELAFEKRQIIVDTATGEYSVIGKLGDGDHGEQFAWISTKLVEQLGIEKLRR